MTQHQDLLIVFSYSHKNAAFLLLCGFRMRDSRLFQAFFARLKGGGLLVGVDNQDRLRRLFSTRND
ncbi:MAG: hypothetical protein O3A00_10455 [Planctomycetota bacterium]|nr:hypothetical protein [Planctomycetota bacterium]